MCHALTEAYSYGSVVPIHSRDPVKFQHQGFGALLMEEAERIARDEHGSQKLAVISGVGTRDYYRKLGYGTQTPSPLLLLSPPPPPCTELDGPYMSKRLAGDAG